MPFDPNDAPDSVFHGILTAIRKEIVGLTLPQIPVDKILIRSYSWEDPEVTPPPYITIVKRGEKHNDQGGTNERDSIIYPAMIAMIYANSVPLGVFEDKLGLYWRQRVRRRFRRGHGGSLPNFSAELPKDGSDWIQTSCDPGEPFIDLAHVKFMVAQYLIVNTEVWEPRA